MPAGNTGAIAEPAQPCLLAQLVVPTCPVPSDFTDTRLPTGALQLLNRLYGWNSTATAVILAQAEIAGSTNSTAAVAKQPSPQVNSFGSPPSPSHHPAPRSFPQPHLSAYRGRPTPPGLLSHLAATLLRSSPLAAPHRRDSRTVLRPANVPGTGNETHLHGETARVLLLRYIASTWWSCAVLLAVVSPCLCCDSL